MTELSPCSFVHEFGAVCPCTSLHVGVCKDVFVHLMPGTPLPSQVLALRLEK